MSDRKPINPHGVHLARPDDNGTVCLSLGIGSEIERFTMSPSLALDLAQELIGAARDCIRHAVA